MGEAKRRASEITKMKAESKTAETNWGEDRTSHSLIVTKEPPPSLIRMRDELAKPYNKDIYDAAIKEPTFETVIATIAAKLSIALDGYYDISDLCEVLYKALHSRQSNKFHNTPAHEQVPGLVNAMMIEDDSEIKLMEFDETVKILAGGTEKNTDAPYTVCNACITTFTCCEERKCCLGKEATQLGNTIKHLKGTLH